jgi:hypothetical protein
MSCSKTPLKPPTAWLSLALVVQRQRLRDLAPGMPHLVRGCGEGSCWRRRPVKPAKPCGTFYVILGCLIASATPQLLARTLSICLNSVPRHRPQDWSNERAVGAAQCNAATALNLDWRARSAFRTDADWRRRAQTRRVHVCRLSTSPPPTEQPVRRRTPDSLSCVRTRSVVAGLSGVSDKDTSQRGALEAQERPSVRSLLGFFSTRTSDHTASTQPTSFGIGCP